MSRIEPRWLFLRQPDMDNYACASDGLTLTPTSVRLIDETGSPTLLLVRPADIDCTIEAEIDFTPVCENDEAGVVMYISRFGYYSVGVKQTVGRPLITVTRSGGGPVPLPLPSPGTRCTFLIRAETQCCHFSVAGEDGVFRPVVTRPVFGRSEAGKCFTGTLFGVYAQCSSETPARARLLRFTMTP